MNESAASAKATLEKAGAKFPNLLDADGKAFAQVGSERLPRTYRARSERQDRVVRHRVFADHAARAAPGAASLTGRARSCSCRCEAGLRNEPRSQSPNSVFDGKNQGRDHRHGHRRARRGEAAARPRRPHGPARRPHAVAGEGRRPRPEEGPRLRPAEGRAHRQRRRGDQQSARSRSSRI